MTVASVNYAAPGFVANTTNHCDNIKDGTYIPRAERYGVLAGLSQDLDDRTKVNVRAFYSRRTTLTEGDLTGTVAVGPNNPAAASLPAGLVLGPTTIDLGLGFPIPAVNQAAVSFNLSPLLGPNAGRSRTLLQEWGANAELTHDIGSNWQLRGLFNWSGSNTQYQLGQLSPTRLAAAGLATTADAAFNPFDVTQNSMALVQDLTDSYIAGQSKDNLVNLRAIAEGKLFSLPGGDVRLAIGYEYINDDLAQRFSSDVRASGVYLLPYTSYDRAVHAVFGELRLPLIADGHGGSMLTVSASGRYDHYSDVGGTANPKVGANFTPAKWVTIRGTWGTSFTAPTPVDELGSLRNTISSFSFVPFSKPGETAPPGAFALALQGSVKDLKPQTANTWSAGVDLQPLDDLRVSATYYSVHFKNIISTPIVNSNIVTNYPNNIITNVNGFSANQLRAYGALAPGGDAVVQSLINSGTLVYEFVDFRVANYGSLDVTGVDFNVAYNHQTGFGSVGLSVSGNKPLSRKSRVSDTAPVVDEFSTDNPQLFLQVTPGIQIGPVLANATWNHNSGYKIAATNSVPVQTHVAAFDTVDLFFKYDVPGSSRILSNLSLTLNVKNIANQDPPILLRNFTSDSGFANGFTFGRMFIFGIDKKF